MDIDLSIIYVNYFSSTFLLNSLTSAKYDLEASSTKFEIIIVNNSPSDVRIGEVYDIAPEAIIITPGSNLGFSRANNLGSELARGRQLLFLNPDTLSTESALSRLYMASQQVCNAGALGVLLCDSTMKVDLESVQAFPNLVNQLFDSAALRRLFPSARVWGDLSGLDQSSPVVPVDVVSGACLMVARKLFEQVGRFPADSFLYSDDVDLCYRLQQAGRQNYLVTRSKVLHFGGKSTERLNPMERAIMLRRERYKFFLRQKGRCYATAYRAGLGLIGAARVLLLGSLCLLGQRQRCEGLNRWWAVTRWVVTGLPRNS